MDLEAPLQLSPYLSILLVMLFGLGLGFGVSALALFLGPKKPNKAKSEPYECGLPILSTAATKLSVKFYLVAIVFIVFDIEAIFLFLWSLLFQELGWIGMAEVGVFALLLMIGLFYILGRGVLKWETTKPFRS